jgi:hypothetical protein
LNQLVRTGIDDLSWASSASLFIIFILPHCISELPNSDPEIRPIKSYKSSPVEVILLRIVKT